MSTPDFDEVQFPPNISLGSRGGPGRQTQIVQMGSGAEARNARWRNSRRKYDVGYGLRSNNDLHTVIEFWEARNARQYGFRYKDWLDYKSCPPDNTPNALDQQIAVAGGTASVFQLIKHYTSGPRTWTRTITKPVEGTLLIAVAGGLVTNWSCDYTTGLITFLSPPSGIVTWGGEFDVPARFDTDDLQAEASQPGAGKYPSIPIMELPLD